MTPPELVRRGRVITREIRGRIEEAQTYYLGRPARTPALPLSEVFDPMRGLILKYFVLTVRTINRTPFIERHCQSAAFLTGLLTGVLIGGCSVFGPGISASVY